MPRTPFKLKGEGRKRRGREVCCGLLVLVRKKQKTCEPEMLRVNVEVGGHTLLPTHFHSHSCTGWETQISTTLLPDILGSPGMNWVHFGGGVELVSLCVQGWLRTPGLPSSGFPATARRPGLCHSLYLTMNWALFFSPPTPKS